MVSGGKLPSAGSCLVTSPDPNLFEDGRNSVDVDPPRPGFATIHKVGLQPYAVASAGPLLTIKPRTGPTRSTGVKSWLNSRRHPHPPSPAGLHLSGVPTPYTRLPPPTRHVGGKRIRHAPADPALKLDRRTPRSFYRCNPGRRQVNRFSRWVVRFSRRAVILPVRPLSN